MTDDPVAVAGVIIVPGRLAALLAWELRRSELKPMVALRTVAHEMAVQQKGRASARGPSGVARPMPASGGWLATDEAASLLRISARQVRRLAVAGELDGQQDTHGHWWIRRDAAEARLNGRRKAQREGTGIGSSAAS